jgi:hypothetical protein
VENHGDDDADWRKLLTRPPELSGSSTSRNTWEQVRGMDEGMRILHISIVNGSLTWCKILRHVASSFTSHPKEDVLRILSHLKIHRVSRV